MTNLIFKVTLENGAAKFKPKILKNAHYLCSGSTDFTQTCMILKSGHSNKPLKFLHLDLIFKVKLKNCLIKVNTYFNAHYLQTGSADFTQIHMNLIHGHDKKLLKLLGP